MGRLANRSQCEFLTHQVCIHRRRLVYREGTLNGFLMRVSNAKVRVELRCHRGLAIAVRFPRQLCTLPCFDEVVNVVHGRRHVLTLRPRVGATICSARQERPHLRFHYDSAHRLHRDRNDRPILSVSASERAWLGVLGAFRQQRRVGRGLPIPSASVLHVGVAVLPSMDVSYRTFKRVELRLRSLIRSGVAAKASGDHMFARTFRVDFLNSMGIRVINVY